MNVRSTVCVALLILSIFAFVVKADDCANSTKCSECSLYSQCFWCQSTGQCLNATTTTLQPCDGGYCQLDMCPCAPWPYAPFVFGQIVLMVFYGLLLAFSAKLIADGSEGLLEILDPGFVGGLVLPILGALPDSAMIFVSGALGSQSEAQSQIDVGMGTLAGSTVMLLTLAWGISLFIGRCDILHGEAVDKKLTKGFHPLNTGVSVDNETPINAIIALVTSSSYLIVQVVAFFYITDPTDGTEIMGWFSLAGAVICFLELMGYCAYQIINPKYQEKKMKIAREDAIKKMVISRMLKRFNESSIPEISANSESFSLNSDENSPLIKDFSKHEDQVDVRSIGLKWKSLALERAAKLESEDDDVSDTESEEEGGEQLSKSRILLKSVILMGLGTLSVSLFSDPMVEVIDDFGSTIGVRSFYISFIITPFCSNASELISSFMLVIKKQRKYASMTYSQLYGAAVMNNTMCLGVFYALIFARGLVWTFNAETMCILFTILIVCTLGAVKKTYNTIMGVIIICLYPAAILFVMFLESPIIGWT